MKARPVVAIVGRPNVGKSTLFNRLAGERLAVVSETPGTTRDRLVAPAEWRGLDFDIVDTGGIDPTSLQKSEPLSIDSADYIEQIRSQAELAARDADAILFVVDVTSGVTAADHEVANTLRRHLARGSQAAPPILLVVNKVDNPARRAETVEFYELGMGEPYPVSALHGTSTGDLLDALIGALGDWEPVPAPEGSVPIAIVGRPNVGKSSLLNRLVGEERVIVSALPGTTRDAIDTTIEYGDSTITLIDTAGIRRRGKVEPGVEKYSVLRALKAIDRAEIVLLLIDAAAGVTSQDAHIAGMALEKYKSSVVLVNKWDAIEKDTHTMPAYARHVLSELRFLDYVPVLFISALTGQRVNQVLPTALQVHQERHLRISTSQVNKLLGEALDKHPPPTRSGRQLRIYYGSQVRSAPPTFVFHVNDPKLVHFTYERYLENQIRERYGFLGTPLRLTFRRRSRAEAGP